MTDDQAAELRRLVEASRAAHTAYQEACTVVAAHEVAKGDAFVAMNEARSAVRLMIEKIEGVRL